MQIVFRKLDIAALLEKRVQSMAGAGELVGAMLDTIPDDINVVVATGEDARVDPTLAKDRFGTITDLIEKAGAKPPKRRRLKTKSVNTQQ